MLEAAEQPAAPHLILRNELAHLIDGTDAVQIAFTLRVAPGKETMATEKHALASRVLFHSAFQLECELKARPLPREPEYFAPKLAVELFQLLLAVRTCRDCDGPVRMEMVNVRK